MGAAVSKSARRISAEGGSRAGSVGGLDRLRRCACDGYFNFSAAKLWHGANR